MQGFECRGDVVVWFVVDDSGIIIIINEND